MQEDVALFVISDEALGGEGAANSKWQTKCSMSSLPCSIFEFEKSRPDPVHLLKSQRNQTQETMKASPSTPKAGNRTPDAAAPKAKKESLVRGERTPSRVFRIEKQANSTFTRVAVNPETQRRKSAKAWEARATYR